MEFLVDFDVIVPDGVPESEIHRREAAEAVRAADLVADGNLRRVWRRPTASGTSTIVGLYNADSPSQLDGILRTLPLYEWMRITITTLDPHPNDPEAVAIARSREPGLPGTTTDLPDPHLSLVYRLEASLGPPLDVGQLANGRRRIVPLTGGRFTGLDISGGLVPGASADWQIVLPDGTAFGDIRYTLQTDEGELIYVRSRSIRHGSAAVLDRLGRGERVDAREYMFRASTQIEAASARLHWMNEGVFTTVGGRTPGGVAYSTYLVA